MRTPKDYFDAAKSTDTTPTDLKELAKSEYYFVKRAVAANKNTESDVLTSLVPESIESYYDQKLVNALAKNSNTPTVALHMIATLLPPILDNGRKHHEGFSAGVALCCRADISIQYIDDLLNHDIIAVQFRKVVARESKRKDVLRILVNDPSTKVKRQAIKSLKKNH